MSTVEARRNAIQSALSARDVHKGESETLTIPWKTGSRILPVVEVQLTAIVLNPYSHRIKADLESHEEDHLFEDPFSEDAQRIIEHILRGQQRYKELLENITTEGQRDPGVVTVDGVLINANRRATALRDLDPNSYIRVAVLPPDAGPSEIAQLELKLQLQQDFKQDYSFTNELLFVNDLIEQGYGIQQAAVELRWKESDVLQHQRILSAIRSLQERCGRALKLVRFDDNKREIMIELDKKLQSLEKSDPDGARRLLDNRALALLTDVGYQNVREISEFFIEDHLTPVAADFATLSESADGGEQPNQAAYVIAKHFDNIVTSTTESPSGLEGLDILGGEDPVPSRSARLLDFLFESLREGEVEVPGSSGIRCSKDSVTVSLNDLITSAAVEAREDRRYHNDLDAPIKYLKDAQKKIKVARERLARTRDDPGFKTGDYKYRVKKLLKDIRETAAEAEAL